MKLPSTPEFLQGAKAQDRATLARAITLIESSKAEHQKLAQELLQALLPQTGKSRRLGISGTPGVGKSTFIENFGAKLAGDENIAVLAVDPTSVVSGGSILGDKTRMSELSRLPQVFIRPTPAGATLGGVARRTRETILLCEAWGFKNILVETVGVGQSEMSVASMVDMFIMLLQPGAGDDLQGIKRGILELVDMIVVTKADGPNMKLVQEARHHYEQALHILRHDATWKPKVLACSSLEKTGLDEIYQQIDTFFNQHTTLIRLRREKQLNSWLNDMLNEAILERARAQWGENLLAQVQQDVKKGHLTVPLAVKKILGEP